MSTETVDFAALREAAMLATFNPAYRVSRCGQQSAHGPHVVESGPDQPRNCPGGPAWSWSFVPASKREVRQTVEWRGDVAHCLEPGCGKTSTSEES